jgi:anti-sigma factor RsiW
MKGHMNDPFNKLRETSWRRKLSPDEEAELRAWLAANPTARDDWETDAALTRVLDRLPDAPVPSNFTARVLQAVEMENAAAQRQPESKWKWVWRSLVPKTAFAMVVLGIGLLSFHEARAAKRMQLAKSVAAISEVASLPGPEILKDFDAIRQLTPTPPPDTELLALLK